MISILNKILSFFILLIFFPLFSLLLIMVILCSYITHPKNTYPLFVPLGARLIMISGLQHFTVKGKVPPKKDGPYLFMFNHESMFDVLMLGGAIPYYINAIGWEGIFKIPLFGYMAKRYGAYAITHDNIDKAKETLKAAEKILLVDKNSMLLSPEGQRTITGEMGEFKKGGFHFAKATNATIVPIGLIGAYRANKRTSWTINPGRLITVFGDPITSDEYANLSVEELRDLTKDKISNLIKS
jgi:1-acyl-sn-glycerol-3-phosphate acyltransferase